LGSSFIALICNRYSATFLAVEGSLGMAQMYKVFVNQKEIILTSTAPKGKGVKVLPLKSTPFKNIIRIIRTTRVKRLYLTHDNPKKLLSGFKKKLPVTIAAGGVVQHEDGKLLFIYRKKRWDLPKGKVDKGESLEGAAKREVKEETGVKKIKVRKLAGVTYHIFKRNNRYQLKETHWFFMKTSYKGVLTPEIKEDITKATWKNKSKIAKAIKKTYPNIEDLFDKSNLMEALFGAE
jgi:ADP-ribose pyrophosphatase YjhB (NUDIX family)